MSAENWTQCPKCKVLAEKEKTRQAQEVRNAYGKVPEEEYAKMLMAARKPIASWQDTLREDFEIGVYGSEFYITYRGYCSVCGFSKKFEHQEVLDFSG